MPQEHLSEDLIRNSLSTAILGSWVIYLDSASSTMDEARRVAQEGAPEGTLVLAEKQSRGRGRFQRAWVSPPGANLYFSLVLRPSLRELSQLSMMASLAFARALGRLVPGTTRATIKWPNDVRIEEKKVGGILIENSLDGDVVKFSIVGLGINVNFDPGDYPEIADIATSLRQELGHPVSRLEVLRVVLEEMEGLYGAIKRGEAIGEEWSSLCDTLGRQVQVTWGDQVYVGYAEGVDEEGNLVIRRADGSSQTLVAGEVTLQA